ncbi:substrate-binding periplasmic protein [Agathobacter sp.]|uniref:substrate-binding periplasmic protein n=1 Tax=Agathobacter sp. TaxID=2021311 RepID=UPI003FD80313
MKKKILAMLLTGVMSAMLVAGCGAGQDKEPVADDASKASDTESEDSEWTAENVEGALDGVKLSFGTTGLFGPFSYYDTDGTTVIGYDVEIEKALQDILGFEMDGDFQVMDYSALTTSLAEGKVDFGMAALCATDERKAVMNFTKTYCDSGQVVMINKETSPEEIKSVDDLADGKYKVAVEKGTASHLYVQNNGFPESCIEVHDTITTAYESLEQGKVDAVIQDGPGARFYIDTTTDSKLEVVGDEFNQGQAPYAIAISNKAAENNPEIVEIFDAAIDKLVADGTMEKLLNGEKYTAE